MSIKRILAAAVIIWFVETVIRWLTCGWLFNWVYTLPPIIWKTPEEMMNAKSMIWSNLLSFLLCVVFVGVFAYLYKGIPGEKTKKGIRYSLLVWIVGSFSGIISMPIYMTIATTVVIYWLIQMLIIYIIDGAIVGAIYKEKNAILN